MQRLLISSACCTFLILLSSSVPVFSQDTKNCFWTNSFGQKVFFPARMCGSQAELLQSTTTLAKPLNNDQSFIKEYFYFANNEKDPMIRNLLLNTIKQSPRKEIEFAKNVCNKMRNGTSLLELMGTQLGIAKEQQQSKIYEMMYSYSGTVTERSNTKLFVMRDFLAINHYCPEFQPQIDAISQE